MKTSLRQCIYWWIIFRILGQNKCFDYSALLYSFTKDQHITTSKSHRKWNIGLELQSKQKEQKIIIWFIIIRLYINANFILVSGNGLCAVFELLNHNGWNILTAIYVRINDWQFAKLFQLNHTCIFNECDRSTGNGLFAIKLNMTNMASWFTMLSE